jgi:hypothetical protein
VVTYRAAQRARLCLDPSQQRFGLIVYAKAGDTNCSMRGTTSRLGSKLTFVPDGDATCRIDAEERGGALTLGEASAACAYYCGPGASYSGVRLRAARGEPAVADLAGDPLC